MELNIPQTTAMDYLEDNSTNELLFGGSAGPGKSWLGCYWQAKRRFKYPGTRGLIGRSTLKTLRETTYVTFLKMAKHQGLVLGKDFKMNNQTNIMTFRNGSEILWKELFYMPSDPDVDELGSLEITDLFIDEANQINQKVKDVAKSRIRHMLDEYDLIPKALYACNPGRNWTKSEFYSKAIANSLEPNKKFVPALLGDNDKISKHYRDNLMGLPKQLRDRLLYGKWDYLDDPTQLCTTEAIEAIFTPRVTTATGKRYITADIARLGKDRTIIRVWDGWQVLRRVVLVKTKTTVTAEKIQILAAKYEVPIERIICDEDGIGGGVVDMLGCKGFIANARPQESKNNDNFATFKDQCGWFLSNKINMRELYEPLDVTAKDSIVEELSQLRDAMVYKDGKKKLVAKVRIKEEIGRSPDDLDCMLMRSAFDLKIIGVSIITGSVERTTNNRTI